MQSLLELILGRYTVKYTRFYTVSKIAQEDWRTPDVVFRPILVHYFPNLYSEHTNLAIIYQARMCIYTNTMLYTASLDRAYGYSQKFIAITDQARTNVFDTRRLRKLTDFDPPSIFYYLNSMLGVSHSEILCQ